MGLFSDIYNTVAKFFRPQEELNGDASKSVATNRLKLVLMQDRTNLTPKILEQMRGEMIDLLSKYLEMDRDLLELNFEQEGDQVALMLSIPVIRAKDEEEIEEAIKASKAQNLEENNEESEEEDDDNDEYDEGDEITEDFDSEECIVDENLSEDNVDNQENDSEKKVKRKRKQKQEVSAPEDLSNEETNEENNEELLDNIES